MAAITQPITRNESTMSNAFSETQKPGPTDWYIVQCVSQPSFRSVWLGNNVLGDRILGDGSVPGETVPVLFTGM